MQRLNKYRKLFLGSFQFPWFLSILLSILPWFPLCHVHELKSKTERSGGKNREKEENASGKQESQVDSTQNENAMDEKTKEIQTERG